MSKIHVRAFQPTDATQLPRFLALAAHEDDAQSALDNPDLARYIENFGRAGDCAIVAHNDEQIIGIAWARIWTLDNRGFGWIDETTPEMAIAVESEFQNCGVGARLMKALKAELGAAGATQIALNVRADSPAVRLYQKLGFAKIDGSERRNWAGGVSFNMRTPLSSKISP